VSGLVLGYALGETGVRPRSGRLATRSSLSNRTYIMWRLSLTGCMSSSAARSSSRRQS